MKDDEHFEKHYDKKARRELKESKKILSHKDRSQHKKPTEARGKTNAMKSAKSF